MDRKDLQLLAVTAVGKLKLPNPARTQLLYYIKEASDAQLKVFIMDGKIVKLDHITEQIVNDRFSVHPINEVGEVGTGALIGAFLGFFTPVPFGLIGGAILGAAAGAAWSKWKEQNERKIRAYCVSKFKEGTTKYNECIGAGKQAMRIKMKQVKEKAKMKAKAKNKK